MQPSATIGRAEEIARAAAWLAEGAPLVCVTGPPGVGKSAVARAVAARTDGALWVSLEDADDWASRVALALGCERGDIGAALARRSAPRLFLDQADFTVEGATDLVSRWLDEAPELGVVVTSRGRSHMQGEHLVTLAPLGTADETSDAVRMFAVLAERLGKPIADAELTTALEIVRALEGLPLAIELAAARLRVMAPRALLFRLGSGGGLDDAIATSLAALLPHERDALAQVGVFRGGFSLTSAEAVVRLAEGAPPVATVLDALLDRSLLLPRDGGRVDCLRVIREHPALALSAKDLAALADRHASHFASLAEALRHGDRAALLADRDNVIAVAKHALGRRPVSARVAEPALRAVVALADGMVDSGALDGLETLLGATLVATQGSGARPSLEAAAVLMRGVLRLARGEVAQASRDLVHALGTAKNLGDASLEAAATLELGRALEASGDREGALAHFDSAAAAFDALGAREDHARALLASGELLRRHGSFDEAAVRLARARAMLVTGPADVVACGLAVARLAIELGAHEQADAELARLRGLVGDEFRASDANHARLSFLSGLSAHDRGDAKGAAEAYAAAMQDYRLRGATRAVAPLSSWLGLCELSRGRIGEAFALANDAVAGARDPSEAAFAAALLCAIEVDAGHAARARALLDAAPTTVDASAREALLAARAKLDGAVDVTPAVTALGRIAQRAWLGRTSRFDAPPDDALLVGERATWFRAPHGRRESLERRPSLARVLEALAARHEGAPGAAVTGEALLAAGWPGERVIPTAGAHRVRVAIATLRKLGLGDVIATAPDGYVIRPQIRLVRA